MINSSLFLKIPENKISFQWSLFFKNMPITESFISKFNKKTVTEFFVQWKIHQSKKARPRIKQNS